MLRTIMSRMPFLPFAGRVIGWHLRYAASRTASPLACGFYITSACNLRCSFCNIRRCDPPYTVDEGRARNLVRELGALKTVYFSVSGGEPLLVPYVFDLLAYAKSAGILYTHVVSNGLLMDAERAEALAKAAVSEISFSLDGPEPFHDAARGMTGSYRRVLEAVGHVKSHAPGTRVVLNTILDPAAPDHALHSVGVARELGVQIKVQPRNDHPALGGADSAPQSRQTFSPEERKALEEAVAALIRAPHVVNSRPFLKNYLAFLFHRDRIMLAGHDCILGHHHVESFVDRLFPCLEGMNWTDGFEWGGRPLSEMFRSPQYAQKLGELRKCRGCQRSYYVCYHEPRLNFPIGNFVRSRMFIP
jgi:MoaA/NifB/PqqE/SkfB family radical SAM enzyme